jgi:hypothetical protein
MHSRTIPKELISQSTRDDKKWHDSVMSKFNQLNDEYGKFAEGENFIEKMIDDKSGSRDDKLELTEEVVFEMINKAKDDIKKIKDKNNELNKKITEYNEAKKTASELIENIEKISDSYYQLSTETQYLNIVNKLEIKDKLIEYDLLIKIHNFISNIDVKLYELDELIKSNNNKIKSFNKLVSKCISDEEKNKNKNACTVCISRKINICLNPCGHTFCSTCIEKMNNNCAMCRQPFISKIKMFIADEDNNYSSDEENNSKMSDSSEEIPGFDGPIPFSQIIDVIHGW